MSDIRLACIKLDECRQGQNNQKVKVLVSKEALARYIVQQEEEITLRSGKYKSM